MFIGVRKLPHRNALVVARMEQRGIRGRVPECAALLPGYGRYKDTTLMNAECR
jgi:hypothetical protein